MIFDFLNGDAVQMRPAEFIKLSIDIIHNGSHTGSNQTLHIGIPTSVSYTHLRAVVMQACAASLIESYCDECQEPIAQEAASRGLYLRPRYSPGYGDFDISYQREFLTVLDCPKRIGLTMTDSFMLAPSKSVTAVIGLTAEAQSCHIAKCMTCKAKSCPFRKD